MNILNVAASRKIAPSESAGLVMTTQRFETKFNDDNAPGIRVGTTPYLARLFVWGAPVLLGVAFASVLFNWFDHNTTFDISDFALFLLTTVLFVWECLPAATACLGLKAERYSEKNAPARSLRTAIVLPMHGEDAQSAIGSALYLLQSLSTNTLHQFVLYILSDTRNEHDISSEKTIIANANSKSLNAQIYYHHRKLNIDHKSGNIREWIEREGASYEAMVVLDADSHVTRQSILRLVDSLAADPTCGLIQSMPRVKAGTSLWQWTQSFATQVYGWPLGIGLSRWMGEEANYYGHNAIIRTKAFATCAGLPRLKNLGGADEAILSHDFVEAALLRRAGWSVRLMPDLEGSYEDTPPTLIGFIKRDSRWCFGNLQHLRILNAAGLHSVSRFHLFSGAMTYLTSVMWFIALVLWASQSADNPIDLTPHIANGPSAFSLIVGVLSIILIPKLIGLFCEIRKKPKSISILRLVAAFFFELLLSTIAGPTLMVHRVSTIAQYAVGQKYAWLPASTAKFSIGDTIRFHSFETLVGLMLLIVVLIGQLSFHIIPVAVCLVLSPVLSFLFSLQFKEILK